MPKFAFVLDKYAKVCLPNESSTGNPKSTRNPKISSANGETEWYSVIGVHWGFPNFPISFFNLTIDNSHCQVTVKIFVSTQNLNFRYYLTLTCPFRKKLWISADSSLIRQKVDTFFIKNDVIKGWLVLINIFFSLQSYSFE